MKKTFYLLLILLVLLPINAFALGNINLYSKEYVLYDSTDDKIIVSKDIDKKANIASITKLMTVLVTLDKIDNVDQEVTITREELSKVPYDAFRIGFKADEKVTYSDLIYATLIPSAGDAASVLASKTYGSTNKCVEAMNNKAKELGLTKTHFGDVIGLDDDNTYSTVTDVLNLLKHVMKDEKFTEFFKTRYTIISGDRELQASYIHYSEIANVTLSNIVAGKTGYTDRAGLCFAFVFNQYGHTYYAVTLGAPVENLKYYKNMVDANSIIQYINDNYEYRTVLAQGDTYNKIKVKNSNIKEYNVTVREDVNILLSVDEDKNKVISKSTVPRELSPSYKKGDKLGTITYYYNGKELASVDVYLEEDIKFSLLGFMESNSTLTLAIVLLIIVIGSIVAMLIVKKGHKKVVK